MKKEFHLVILIFFFIPCQAQKVKLELNLEEGKTYHQTQNNEVTILQEFDGKPFDMELVIEAKTSFKVLRVHPNKYDLEVKYGYIHMAMESPLGIMEFSTEDTDDNIFAQVFRRLANGTFEITIKPTGELEEIRKITELFNYILEGFPDLSETKIKEIWVLMERSFGEDAFKGNMDMIYNILPEKLVKEGNSWNKKTRLKSAMPGSISSKFKLEKVDSNTFLIRGASVIKSDDKQSNIAIQGGDIYYDLTGTMDSEIEIDRNSGWIKSAWFIQKMEGFSYLKKPTQSSEENKMPISITSKMILSDE